MFSLGYQVGSVKVQKVIVVSKKVFFHAKPAASLNTSEAFTLQTCFEELSFTSMYEEVSRGL